MANDMRLIDANKIKYKEDRGGGGRDYPENIVTEDEIAKMPTVNAVEIPDCKKCAFNEGIAYWHQCERCIGQATNNFLAKEEI